MANIQVKLRRGTSAEHDTTDGGFTGAEGEVTVDTTNDTLRVHDGSTAGGVRLAKLSEVSGGTGTVTSVASGTGLTGGPITTTGTLALANTSVTAGSYTSADITVDPQGRITAAASGSGGGSVSKYTAAWNNSHGAVTVANGSTHTITHNLGTTDITVAVYVNSSASDTNAQQVSIHDIYGQGHLGFSLTDLSSNSFVLQLASTGYSDVSSTGSATVTAWTSKYIKVVIIG